MAVIVQVRTILSQNTTDNTSHRAFASLKEAFPTWEEVLEAPSGNMLQALSTLSNILCAHVRRPALYACLAMTTLVTAGTTEAAANARGLPVHVK